MSPSSVTLSGSSVSERGKSLRAVLIERKQRLSRLRHGGLPRKHPCARCRDHQSSPCDRTLQRPCKTCIRTKDWDVINRCREVKELASPKNKKTKLSEDQHALSPRKSRKTTKIFWAEDVKLVTPLATDPCSSSYQPGQARLLARTESLDDLVETKLDDTPFVSRGHPKLLDKSEGDYPNCTSNTSSLSMRDTPHQAENSSSTSCILVSQGHDSAKNHSFPLSSSSPSVQSTPNPAVSTVPLAVANTGSQPQLVGSSISTEPQLPLRFGTGQLDNARFTFIASETLDTAAHSESSQSGYREQVHRTRSRLNPDGMDVDSNPLRKRPREKGREKDKKGRNTPSSMKR